LQEESDSNIMLKTHTQATLLITPVLIFHAICIPAHTKQQAAAMAVEHALLTPNP
jgi:hypothetical protein